MMLRTPDPATLLIPTLVGLALACVSVAGISMVVTAARSIRTARRHRRESAWTQSLLAVAYDTNEAFSRVHTRHRDAFVTLLCEVLARMDGAGRMRLLDHAIAFSGHLRRAMRSPRASRRAWAVHHVVRLRIDRGPVAMLQDRSDRVAATAAFAIAREGTAQARRTLLARSSRFRNWDAERWTTVAHFMAEDPGLLAVACRDERLPVVIRMACLHALALRGGPTALLAARTLVDAEGALPHGLALASLDVLAWWGTAADDHRTLRFIDAPDTRLRAAAVRAWGVVTADRNLDMLLALAGDPEMDVARAAVAALRERGLDALVRDAVRHGALGASLDSEMNDGQHRAA